MGIFTKRAGKGLHGPALQDMEFISKFEHIPYKFESIPYRHDSAKKYNCYLLKGNNIQTATKHILSLNAMLRQAQKKCSGFLNFKIRDFDIKYVDEFFYPGAGHEFCYLTVTPLTKTGKDPKFPLVLHFYTLQRATNNDNLFGEIHYLQNGEIGKARIVCWRKKSARIVHCKLVNGELTVSKVERLHNDKWEAVYKL